MRSHSTHLARLSWMARLLLVALGLSSSLYGFHEVYQPNASAPIWLLALLGLPIGYRCLQTRRDLPSIPFFLLLLRGLIVIEWIAWASFGIEVFLTATTSFSLAWCALRWNRSLERHLLPPLSILAALATFVFIPGPMTLVLAALTLIVGLATFALLHRPVDAERLPCQDPKPSQDRLGRLAHGSSLGALALILAVSFSKLQMLVEPWEFSRAETSATPQREREEPERLPSGPVGPRSGEIFPESLIANDAPQNRAPQAWMEVAVATSRGDAHDGRPFLLRGHAMDWPSSERRRSTTAYDSTAPWIDVGPRREPFLDLHLAHPSTRLASRQQWLLFTCARPSAWRLAQGFSRGDKHLREDSEHNWFVVRPQAPEVRYTARVDLESFDRHSGRHGRDLRTLAQARAHHPDPHYTTVPRWPVVVELRDEIEQRLRRGDTDLERIRDVIATFRASYEYDRARPFTPNAEGARLFERDKIGLCSHFATAALLRLRMMGIATRITTGYVVHDWQEDLQLYDVWDTDRHAWIEVHFESLGWIPFDPTPPSLINTLREMVGASPLELELPNEGDAEEESLFEFASSYFNESGSSLIFLLGLASVLVVLFWLGQKWAHAVESERRKRPDPLQTLLARLLRALERHPSTPKERFRKRRGQTLREFADELKRRDAQRYAPLENIMSWLYRARFTDRDLSSAEREHIERFIRGL